MKKQLNQLRRFFARTGARKLNAATAREVIPASYDDDDNSNRLSGAFIVVLALHVIALVGVFAFSRMTDPKAAAGTTPQVQSSSSIASAAATFAPTPDSTPAPEPTPAPAQASPAQYASLQPNNAPTPAATEAANDRADAARVTRPRPGSHVVKSGETLSKIAFANNLRAADLMAANSLKSDEIRVGQELIIPDPKSVKTTAEAKAPPKAPAKTTSPVKTPAGSYTVRKNDSLIKIAREQKVSYDDLVKLNGIKDPRKLQEGQVLKLPKRG
jgi:LysM repeat protein